MEDSILLTYELTKKDFQNFLILIIYFKWNIQSCSLMNIDKKGFSTFSNSKNIFEMEY